MRPLVIQVVIVLVLGFLFQESKTNKVSLTQTCNINFTSVNCFYNATSTFDGFNWYTNGQRCGTYSYFANGTCTPYGTQNCTGFTYTCSKNNTSTMTLHDTMLYSDTEEQHNLTCQPIQQTPTNKSQLNNQTLHLKVHPRLLHCNADDKISQKIDQNVELWIKVVALPPPNFTWFHIVDGLGKSISSRTNLKVVSKKLKSNLTIFRILPTDGGTYMVRAENECGAVEQQYHIKVEGGNDSTSKNSLPYIAAVGCLLVLVIVVILPVKLCHCQKEGKSVPEPRPPPLPRKSIEPHYNIIIDSETNPLANNSTNLSQAVPGTSIHYPSTSSQSHILKNGVGYALVNKRGKGKGKSMGSQQKLSVNTDEDTLKYVELSFNEKKDDKFQCVNNVHGRAESVAYAEVRRIDTSLQSNNNHAISTFD